MKLNGISPSRKLKKLDLKKFILEFKYILFFKIMVFTYIMYELKQIKYYNFINNVFVAQLERTFNYRSEGFEFKY